MKIVPVYQRKALWTVAPAGMSSVSLEDTGVVRGSPEPPCALLASSWPPPSARP